MPDCKGSAPLHSTSFVIGEYAAQKDFVRGRSLTFRGVEVRECGCHAFDKVGQLCDLVEASPRRRVFTWRQKLMEWR